MLENLRISATNALNTVYYRKYWSRAKYQFDWQIINTQTEHKNIKPRGLNNL